MKKAIKNVLIVLYAIIAVVVTICLLSYNEYKVTEFGDYSLVIVDNRELEPDYQKGDLVIVEKDNKIEIGDKIFFYNTYEQKIGVSYATVTGKEIITSKETTYTLDGQRSLSSEYVIGSENTSTRIGTLGTILGILESKWGFLFLIVFPSLLAFLYEIWEVVIELKANSKKSSKKENKNESKNEEE
ncbi:MAG: hypothetical protein ACLUD1_02845 [Clostridia bacterium]